MRKIARLPFGVHHCSALPQKATDDWFIETDGVPEHDGPIRLSATAVREAARIGGLPSDADYERAKQDRDLARARVGELETEIESLREFEKSAVYSLEHIGQKVRKKPGRKPKEEEVVA